MKPLNSITCKCYMTMDKKKINGRINNLKHYNLPLTFYGGRCAGITESRCDCGREYYLFLERGVNCYEVFDMALKADLKPIEKKAEQLDLPPKTEVVTADMIADKLKYIGKGRR